MVDGDGQELAPRKDPDLNKLQHRFRLLIIASSLYRCSFATLRGLIFAGTYFRETIFSRNNLIFAELIFANLPVFYRISFIFLGLLGKKPYISRIKRFLKFSRGLIFANLQKNSRTSRNIIPAKINPLKGHDLL